jgi:hypothetical protein
MEVMSTNTHLEAYNLIKFNKILGNLIEKKENSSIKV